MKNYRKPFCGIVVVQVVTLMLLLYIVYVVHQRTSSPFVQDYYLKKTISSKVLAALAEHKKDREGFLVSLGFWEQQTQGLLNFHQLQCLANQTGMRVAQPFLTGTLFRPYPSTKDDPNLGKVYNMEAWNEKLFTLHKYKPVLSWETLIREAPKPIIIHCIQYQQLGTKNRNFKGFQNGCSESCYDQFDSILKLLQKEGFEEVRRSCTNFYHLSFKEKITFDEFKINIFRDYDPSKVTVILNEFRGIEFDDRTDLRFPLNLNSPCAQLRDLPPNIILPSAQIIKDAEKYFKEKNKNTTIGIMARIEKIQNNPSQKISECIKQAIQITQDLYKNHRFSNMFLAMDVGKYGSTSFSGNQVRKDGQTFFESLHVYNTQHLTFQEWEGMFSHISSSNNPAYVGNLQRTIVAKTKCLVLLGGASFQSQAIEWHHYFHPEQPEECVYYICYN